MNVRNAASSLSALLLLAALQGGCTPSQAITFDDDVDATAQAVGSAVAGLELVDVALEVDGAPGGFARSVSVDELGDVSVTFVAGESDPLLNALLSSLGGEDVELDLRAQDGTTGGLEVVGATPLEVSFSPLDSKEGKKLLQVSAKWQAQNLKYVGGGGKAQGVMGSKAKLWSVEIPGLDASTLEGFTLSARRPTSNYAAWEVSGLKVEISASGYASAMTLIDADMEVPVDLVVTDESTGGVAKVKTKGKPKKGTTTTTTTTTTTIDFGGVQGESVEANHDKSWSF